MGKIDVELRVAGEQLEEPVAVPILVEHAEVDVVVVVERPPLPGEAESGTGREKEGHVGAVEGVAHILDRGQCTLAGQSLRLDLPARVDAVDAQQERLGVELDRLVQQLSPRGGGRQWPQHALHLGPTRTGGMRAR